MKTTNKDKRQKSKGKSKQLLLAGLMYGLNILSPCFAQDSCNTVITGNTAVCNGESTTLTAFTALQDTAYTYQWSTGGTTDNITVNLSADSAVYWVAVSNGSCTDTAYATVKETTPTARIVGDTLICKGESTTLTAECGTSYLWNTGETTAAITVSPANSTTYTVTTCGVGTSAQVTVNCTGINDQQQAASTQFQVFPNPNDGDFELEILNSKSGINNAVIKIYDVLGREIYKSEITNQSFKIQNLKSKIDKGVYFLQLTTEEGVWNEKVIVQ